MFTLIGRPTMFFTITWEGDYAGIPCVKGIYANERGKQFSTLARKADVEFH